MTATLRMSLVACLALAGSMPAHAEDRQVTADYTGWQQTNVNQAEGLPGVFGGWMEFQAFTPEYAASVTITDVTGNPVAGVITQNMAFPGAWHTFCGSSGPVAIDLGGEGFSEFFVRLVGGNGPDECGTTVPIRGTVTVTIHK